MNKAASVVEPGVRWTLDMSVINSKDRTKCPVSGCGEKKDPRQPCCPNCFKKFGLELVDAIKKACGVPAYVRTPPATTKRAVAISPSTKATPRQPKTEARPQPAKTAVVAKNDPLKQVLELATKRLQEHCLEVYAQLPTMDMEYLQFIVGLAYQDCPFPQVLELIPETAVAARTLYWQEVAAEVVTQEKQAEERRLKASEEAAKLERLERCKKLALQLLPKLPVEVVDVYGLTAELIRRPEYRDLPSAVLTADLKTRLAVVRSEGNNPDLTNARCRWAAKNHLKKHPQDANLPPAVAAKKIANLRPKCDPLSQDGLENAFRAEVALVKIQTAKSIAQYLDLPHAIISAGRPGEARQAEI